MTARLGVGFFLVLAMPSLALAQQGGANHPAAAQTVADARKVVQLIASDPAKTKLYCELLKISDQIDAAAKNDRNKVDELTTHAYDVAFQLGPEYVALMKSTDFVDHSSDEGKALTVVLAPLDKLCGAK